MKTKKSSFGKKCRRFAAWLAAAYVLANIWTYVQDMGKPTILFVGDSVTDAKIEYKLWKPYSLYRYCYAWKLPFYHEALYAHGGWCRLVGERKGFNWYDAGSGGATLADNGQNNAIVKRVKELAHLKDFDYIIVSGGINDLEYNHWMGDDNTSSIQALREICATLKGTKSKVGFIIPYYTGKHVDAMRKYGDMMRSVCEEYGVPFLDQRESAVRLDTKEGMMRHGIAGKDWLHCNEAAYQILADDICRWMEGW